jgi:hypothetical protein
MPRFNMQRMLTDYAEKFYSPAAEQWRKYSATGFSGAREVAEWKARIHAAWPRIGLRRIDKSVTRIGYGETMLFEVAVQLDGLTPEDLTVEMVFTRPGAPTTVHARRYQLQHERAAGKRRAPFFARTDARPVRQDGIPVPRVSDPSAADPSLRDGQDALVVSTPS